MVAAALPQSVSDALASASGFVQDNKAASIAAGIGAGLGVAFYANKLWHRSHRRPSSFEITGGSLARDKVKDEVKGYYDSFGTLERGKGATVTRKEKVAELVDKFYSLVTDLYEWGWGQSFHFSPKLPMHGWAASEAAHEARIPGILGLAPGKTALDVGCGVGGPMRTIAATSGGNVVGITINAYQVQRAKFHNDKVGLAEQCEVVRGNFLEMPFEANTFDGAYAIEATCHAARLEDVYAEVFRVLKPGAKFVTYEWVTTKLFDGKDEKQVAVVDEIIIGNGLPEMRTWKEAEEAGKKVGFKLLRSEDLATSCKANAGCDASVVNPWYGRLTAMGKPIMTLNAAIVSTLEFLRIAPKGMSQVHKMLEDTAYALIEGGQKGIFTPMHMLVLQKPE